MWNVIWIMFLIVKVYNMVAIVCTAMTVHACMQWSVGCTAMCVLWLRTCGRWCDLRLGLALCCAGPISSSLSSSSGHMSSLSYRAMRAVMKPDLLLLLMGPPPLHRACIRRMQKSCVDTPSDHGESPHVRNGPKATGQQIAAKVNLLCRNRTRCIRAGLPHPKQRFCTTRIALSWRLGLLLYLAL